jgi:thioredoxin reductase (NADPH)
MSRYLIDQIEATRNIDVCINTEVVGAGGDGTLETLTLADNATGATRTVPAAALVVLIGAVPHTDWLPDGVARDEHGFIITGDDVPTAALPERGWPPGQIPRPLETSMPGVFAAGDVRQRSIKRVASAVGDGTTAGSLAAHHLLASETAPGRR